MHWKSMEDLVSNAVLVILCNHEGPKANKNLTEGKVRDDEKKSFSQRREAVSNQGSNYTLRRDFATSAQQGCYRTVSVVNFSFLFS